MAKPLKGAGSVRKRRAKRPKDAPPQPDPSRIREFRKLTAEKIKGRTQTEHERIGRALESVDHEGLGEE